MKALTLAATRHGNPGRTHVLPAGIWIEVEPASNLPEDSLTKWWAKPYADDVWAAELQAWAEGPGCGLFADDIVLASDLKTYADLDDSVRDRLDTKFRDWNVSWDDWPECTIDFWKGTLEFLGFSAPEINYTGFWSQGDGASFTAGSFDLVEFSEAVTKLDERKAKEGLPDTLDRTDLAKPLRFAEVISEYLEATVVRCYAAGNYYHENTVRFDWRDSLPEEWHDGPQRPTHPNIQRIASTFVEECDQMLICLCQSIYRSLEKEYEYQTSVEAVSEALECNDIVFTEDGKRIDLPTEIHS